MMPLLRICLTCPSIRHRVDFASAIVIAILACGASIADERVGPIVGSVEATSAVVMYRPAAAAKSLRFTLTTVDGEVVASHDASTTAGDDYVAKFACDDLLPDTTYRYQITDLADHTTIPAEPTDDFSFRTARVDRTGHRVSVAFISCVDIEPSKLWDEMQKLSIDALCLMGDTPYIDNTDLNIVRERHRQFLQMPDLQKLGQTRSIIGVWDDHDFGLNNGNGRNFAQHKQKTRKAFVEYRAHRQFGNGTEGVYHKIDLGMIEVFLLDPRSFSQTEPSPVDATQPTCFGKDQWNWLLQVLKDSKAPFKVLSMGAIWEDKKNKETDDMFTYWYERDALLDLVKEQGISGVVLLGGDIHVARHLIHPQRVGYDLHDFVISPGHTRTITDLDVYHPSLEWSLVEGWQFMVLTADGTGAVPKLTAEFRQPDVRLNRRVELSLEQLTPRVTKADMDRDLRVHLPLDGMQNTGSLGTRADAEPYHGAQCVSEGGITGGCVQLVRPQSQFLNIPRSVLDDNSDEHTISLWARPTTLPEHGSSERYFLFESTAKGPPDAEPAYHLSLGIRSGAAPDRINLQVFTRTLQPAQQPEAAPTPLDQGPFDCEIPRELLDTRWAHVTMTFDSKTIELYVNGEQVAGHKLTVPGPAAESGGLVIGGHRAGVGRNFDGYLDELKIWSRKLAAEEIASLHASMTNE